MRNLYAILMGIIIGAAVSLHAQTAWPGGFNDAGLSPLQSPPEDSIISLLADLQALPLLNPNALPSSGTFWLETPTGVLEPWPILPPGLNLSGVYALPNGTFLVGTGNAPANPAMLEAQAQAVVNLIGQAQTAAVNQAMRARPMGDGGPMPGPGNYGDGSGDYTNNYTPVIINTNLLWLGIPGVSNDLVYLNLCVPANLITLSNVYGLYCYTNLLTAPQPVAEAWLPNPPPPTNPVVVPFVVPTQNLPWQFYQVIDWTSFTENGNTTPDWWLFYFFATTALLDSSLDSQGNPLLSDYLAGTDPNLISFTVAATNNDVNQSSVSVQVNVTAGIPSYYAVLVNDSNPSDANWQAYPGSTIPVTLGGTDGVYTISVGLRGLPPMATQTWQSLTLTRDTVAPTVVITSPTMSVTAQPTIQLQGYATKALSAVSYGISNALGVVSAQPGFVTLAYFDPVVWSFTTNWIQCYDLDLTNGLNTITLRVTDEAGNTTTTNLNLTLDYTTATNPVVQVVWPPDGAQICAPSFTCRGTLDDPTASVQAQITDANTNTTTIAGLVGRDGGFWVENLPLTNGVNTLSLVVSNAAGLMTTTNLTVSPGPITLTLDPVPSDQLWQPQLNVTGEVSDPSCSVWVNGVPGVNNGDGTWYALSVPNAPGGVATFDLTAQSSLSQMDELTGVYFNSDTSSQNPSANNSNTNKPAQIVVTKYDVGSTNIVTYNVNSSTNAQPHAVGLLSGWTNYYNLHWQEDAGTTGDDTFISASGSCTTNFNWPPDEYILGVSSPSRNGTQTDSCSSNQVVLGPPPVQLESCHISITTTNGGVTTQYMRSAQTTLTLLTGGPGQSKRYRLYDISGSATAITNVITGAGCPVPPTQIAMGELGNLGADSNLWRTLQDNATKDITPKVSGLNPNYYTFTAPTKTIYTLTHQTLYPAYSDTNLARLNLGVGEYVTFSGMPAGTQWTNTGGGLSTNIGAGVTFTAPSNAVAGVTVTAKYQGQGLQSTFNVAEPSFHGISWIVGTNSLPVGIIGAGMTNGLYFNPQNVSFYRVYTWELPVVVANVKGYFTNLASSIPTNVEIGGAYLTSTTTNFYQDRVKSTLNDFFAFTLPLYQGSWDYDVTNLWTIPGSNITNYWGTATSTSTLLNSAGDFSVTKWGQTVTRSTNNVYR